MRTPLVFEKTRKGWTASFSPLGIVDQGRTKREARWHVAASVDLFLATASAPEVFERMNRHRERLARRKPVGNESTQAAESNLAGWLTDARTAEFFGSSFTLKADVLACVLQGGNLAAVARGHGVTRAAASKQARRAKSIFGNLRLTPGNS